MVVVVVVSQGSEGSGGGCTSGEEKLRDCDWHLFVIDIHPFYLVSRLEGHSLVKLKTQTPWDSLLCFLPGGRDLPPFT